MHQLGTAGNNPKLKHTLNSNTCVQSNVVLLRSPISLYFADTQERFSPELRPENEHYRLIAENPVAGARFFYFIVEMFVKHVLGVNQNHPGLYSKTAAYYVAVEQQGRLTLHLHMLL